MLVLVVVIVMGELPEVMSVPVGSDVAFFFGAL
jgi:hypothetical protein